MINSIKEKKRKVLGKRKEEKRTEEWRTVVFCVCV